MLFQQFQPGLRPVEKFDQPNLLKTVFPRGTQKKPNQPNQPETVDTNKIRPKITYVKKHVKVGLHFLGLLRITLV